MPNYITKTKIANTKSVMPTVSKPVYREPTDAYSLINKILPLIPKPKDGLNGLNGASVSLQDVMKELLRLLESGALKLKVGQIEGLQNKLDQVRGDSIRFGARGGEGSWKVKNLSGAIDGSNTEFTVAGDKPATNSHHVVLNYQEINPLTDYTVTYANGLITITYTTAPDISLAGKSHYIRYM